MLARRGSVNRALSGENRALVGDDETDEQERRPSARRGVRKRICKGDTANMHETIAGVPANVIAITVTQPRGAEANTPPFPWRQEL
jgi:hypothetical protein